ncbi:MAG: helix-turn-helix transcriptional regulator [Bacteroidetes bacterium]|nr:helix-turn-helix transcriptional regulator [Bacteroidota bacterium]
MPEIEPYGKNVIQKHQVLRLERIASFCRNLRLNSGYSQKEMAQLCGLSRSTIQQLEHGGNIRLVTLFKILDAHFLSLDDFFEEME